MDTTGEGPEGRKRLVGPSPFCVEGPALPQPSRAPAGRMREGL
jgi:hypothetical protein